MSILQINKDKKFSSSEELKIEDVFKYISLKKLKTPYNDISFDSHTLQSSTFLEYLS